MQVVQADVAVRHLQLDVFNIEGIIGNMDIGGQALQRQTTTLIKGESLDTDVEVVILELRQGHVGTQVANGQMIDIEAVMLVRLIQHVIGQCRLAHDQGLDLNVKRLGRLVLLRLEGIDDELHIGGAILIGPRHMTIQPDNFSIGNDNTVVGNQILEADTGTQFVDGEQGTALLVMDLHILQLELVKRRYRYRADADLGIEEFT